MDSGLKISKPPEPASRPGRRDQKKQETRAVIYDMALRLFLERGFEQVTMDEIAEKAGVSRATVFNYFPSKTDFIAAYGDEYRDTLLGYWETLFHLPPLSRLDTMCRFAAKEAERRKDLMDLLTVNTYMSSPERSREERNRWFRLYELLASTIEDARAAGEIRAGLDTTDIVALFDAAFSSVFAERVIAGADTPVHDRVLKRYEIVRAGIIPATQDHKP